MLGRFAHVLLSSGGNAQRPVVAARIIGLCAPCSTEFISCCTKGTCYSFSGIPSLSVDFFDSGKISAWALSCSKSLFLFLFAASALILTHHAYAFFGLVFVAVYLLVRVFTEENTWAEKFKTLAFFAFSSICAFLVSAFSLLPFILELHEVQGMPKIPFHLLLPAAPSMEEFTHTCWDDASLDSSWTHRQYFVCRRFVDAIFHPFDGIRHQDKDSVGLVWQSVLALFARSSPTLCTMSKISIFGFFSNCLDGLHAGCCAVHPGQNCHVREFKNKMRPTLRTQSSALLLALVLVDLGPTTFQSVYNGGVILKGAVYNGSSRLDSNYKVIERQSIRYDPEKAFGKTMILKGWAFVDTWPHSEPP